MLLLMLDGGGGACGGGACGRVGGVGVVPASLLLSTLFAIEQYSHVNLTDTQGSSRQVCGGGGGEFKIERNVLMGSAEVVLVHA